ncbi:hypothetical protein LCGC14_1822690 [marine sediment metagenome]|uniref:Glycosyltransferase 2-like domain-containing protein n=1 Tax=marine sediment metagenome TaxID=412755 RepID=A0A0F9GIF6_9ZZZZ
MIKQNKIKWRKRLLVSTPTEGWIRFEWAYARYGQIIPVNWEVSGFDVNFAVLGYSVDDAYNLITKKALEMKVEWLLIIEDDVLVPQDLFIKVADYITDGSIPVVSGLYYTKALPSEPLIFRGRGNGVFLKWKLGQKVWGDGLPMGCLLIHTSILKWFWENTEKYKTIEGEQLSRVFETPKKMFIDPETGSFSRQEGTQDLYFFDRMIDNDVLKKTGWKDIARKKYPLLCDTNIFCKHIDRNTGKQYP